MPPVAVCTERNDSVKKKKSFLLSITDEELFYSSWLKKEYEDLGLALTGRADPRIVVKLMKSSRDEVCFAARTNGDYIQVHPFSDTFAGLSRLDRYGVIYGVVVHEIAHILYTDFRCHIFCSSGARMYEMKRRVLHDTGVNIDDLGFTDKAWIAEIENCIEDGYIENAFRSNYAGVPSIYLKRARAFLAKDYDPVAKMYKGLGLSAPFVSNCALFYSTTGRLDFRGFPTKGELAKKLVGLMEIIDEAVIDTDQINRWVAAVKIYQLFADVFSKGDDPSRDSRDVDENTHSTAPEKPKDIKDHRKKKKHKKAEGKAEPEESKDAESKEVDESDDAETEKPESSSTASSAPSSSDETESEEKGDDEPSSAPETAEEGEDEEDADDDDFDLSEALSRLGLDPEEEDDESGYDGDEDGSESEGDGRGGHFEGGGEPGDDEEDVDDIIKDDLEASVGRVMKGIAEDKEEEETNAERKEDADGASSESSGDFKLVPTNPVPWQANPDATSKYARVMDKVRPVSKRLQRSLISELQDREYGAKRSGLLIGKRFEARNAYRMDMRAFSTNKAPTELKSLAVAVLVDLSGSMSNGIRIPTAIETAALVQDFCSGLNFPVAVYGHDATSEGCNVYTFTEWSNKGREAIADMYAKSDNHDGHALRYVKKRLLRRPEPNKLLIYISDGVPANGSYPGVSYYGPPATLDLKAFVKEAKKDSVALICAGIGADRDKLSSIYGDAFMDISDLTKLPVLIVRCIKRMIAQVE